MMMVVVMMKIGCCVCRCKWMLDAQGQPQKFSAEDQQDIVKHVIEPMASNGMRTICIAYKDYILGLHYLMFQ